MTLATTCGRRWRDLARKKVSALALSRHCLYPFPGMICPAHLAENLRRPLPTKDGGVLRTVADAANYMVALPDDRRLAHWQRAAQLLLDGADAAEISRQIELALFYDRKLDLKASKADIAVPAPEQSNERSTSTTLANFERSGIERSR